MRACVAGRLAVSLRAARLRLEQPVRDAQRLCHSKHGVVGSISSRSAVKTNVDLHQFERDGRQGLHVPWCGDGVGDGADDIVRRAEIGCVYRG